MITANVTQMFSSVEPWDCSNNAATVGESVGRITWTNAMAVASKHESWLESPLADACQGMREWARETGAWDSEEIAAWSDEECLALFVQNIASELRNCLGVDDNELAECVALYESTDWEQEGEYPIGSYYMEADACKVQYHTGV